MNLYQRTMGLVRNILVGSICQLVGTDPKVRRLGMGPIRNRKICIDFRTSPRTFLGINEPWIARLARQHIKPADVIYDIGAHVGYTSLVFAQALKGTGAVYAFEILNYTTARFLTRTVQANDFKNIYIKNVGLGAVEQTLKLPIGPTAMTSIYGKAQRGTLEECRVVPIDQYAREQNIPPPALVKIDIEGAEIDCLRGGTRVFNQSKPVMLIEFHSLELLREGYDLLRRWGYRLTTRNGAGVDEKFVKRLENFHQTVLCEYRGANGQPA